MWNTDSKNDDIHVFLYSYRTNTKGLMQSRTEKWFYVPLYHRCTHRLQSWSYTCISTYICRQNTIGLMQWRAEGSSHVPVPILAVGQSVKVCVCKRECVRKRAVSIQGGSVLIAATKCLYLHTHTRTRICINTYICTDVYMYTYIHI